MPYCLLPFFLTVDNVIDLVPQIDDLIAKLDKEREHISQIGEDLSKEIAELRENIKISRGEASRVSNILNIFLTRMTCWHRLVRDVQNKLNFKFYLLLLQFLENILW